MAAEQAKSTVNTDVHLFTSESVTEGHPDKVCDQISDAILDAYMAADPHSHVAVETCATAGQFVIFGEVSSTAHITFLLLRVECLNVLATPILELA